MPLRHAPHCPKASVQTNEFACNCDVRNWSELAQANATLRAENARLQAGRAQARAVVKAARLVVENASRCPYCANTYTGLPGNACENCMNSGLADHYVADLANALDALSPALKEEDSNAPS